ncbi:prepilin-type N-terminal cleavage/methylation domain-containing protein [Patescibacteria group bacterium]|nr:prepilin-type N-terminal cleavage/methylation domain-containing protein [Patescibacteria group bacterium]
MKNFKKGFTLIELLVVVAIIGLLASITMGYLGSARKKGNDTAVKTNLATARTSIEIFFLNNNNTYLPAGDTAANGEACPLVYNASGANMFSRSKETVDSIAEAVKRGGNGSACYNSDNLWAVAVGLSLTENTSWCVDVAGGAKIVNAIPSAAINPLTLLCN